MILRAGIASIIGVIFTFLCVVAGIAGTWLADRDLPIDVRRVELITPEVNPGDVLQVKFTVFRYRSCGFHADRLLIDSDGNREVLDDIDFRVNPNRLGDDTFITTIRVPSTFKPGPARYVSVSQHRCNLIHNFWPIPGGISNIAFAVVPR